MLEVFGPFAGLLAGAVALVFGRNWWSERKRARDFEDELAARRRAEARHVAAAEAAWRRTQDELARRPPPDPRRREDLE